MRDKQFTLKMMRYENEILELLERQLRDDDDSFTQSDLQGAAMALVMRILDERKITVDHEVYRNQLGAIATAMAEMDENAPSAFQLFIDRMVALGAMKIT